MKLLIMVFSSTGLAEALDTLGELLADRGQSAEVVTIGGGRLLLLQLIDQGPHSKHARDLKELKPSSEQRSRAAAWCRTHDSSAGSAEQMFGAVEYIDELNDTDPRVSSDARYVLWTSRRSGSDRLYEAFRRASDGRKNACGVRQLWSRRRARDAIDSPHRQRARLERV